MFRVRVILSVLLVCLCLFPARADRNDRGITSLQAKGEPFLRKGGWLLGGSATASGQTGDNYRLAVIGGINNTGYNVSVKPTFLYAIRDDMAIGASAVYRRTSFDLASAGLEVMGASIDVEDYFSIGHNYGGAFLFRKYLTLGQQGRFALFVDAQMQLTGGQSKVTDRQNGSIKGTYQTSWDFSLGVNPGLSAYITNHLVMGASVGIFGLDYSRSKQIHNQVYDGSKGAFSGSYSLNLLALSVGIYYSF